jgi:hypothetical protein
LAALFQNTITQGQLDIRIVEMMQEVGDQGGSVPLVGIHEQIQ